MLKTNKLFHLFSRVLLKPEPFTFEPFHDQYKISSAQYEFVIENKPPPEQAIYTHRNDTPAAVLKKKGIHIFPQDMPALNKSQKFNAVSRQLEQQYQNAFRNCKSGKQIFHLERKIKSDIRRNLYFIGSLASRYQHFLAFQPYLELQASNTQQQYEKKGVEVEALGGKIYPLGKVWLPTSQRYLIKYCDLIKQLAHKPYNVLDLGCGCGILSFLFAKAHKKSKVIGVDKNPAAIQTTNVNAARLGLQNIEAIQCDMNKPEQFNIKSKENQLPSNYDWIVLNPPWMCAASLPGQSIISEAVYDNKMSMLENSIKLARKLLAQQGKLIVIYSDLSQLIGLTERTVESMGQQNGFIVESLEEIPLLEGMPKKSALQEYKSKAKIQTYVLKLK